MAVLKDLIVHGNSRFLNVAQFKDLIADTGRFQKLTTNVLGEAGQTISVYGIMNVEGELNTKSWTNANIATIGGNMYICPTISISEGSTGTVTVGSGTLTFSPPSGSSFALDNLLGGSSNTSSWTQNSLVLVTGEILYNNEYLPMGTLKGKIGSGVSTSSFPITNVTNNKSTGTTADIFNLIPAGSYTYRNLKISIYEVYTSSKLYPLGIYFTAMGSNGRTFIDIYGGNKDTGTATAGAGNLAEPNVRIGNLKGLPQIMSTYTPTGWGIYTNNGYFTGTVVAKQGKIGDGSAAWTIGNDTNSGAAYIYTGTLGASNSAFMSTGYGTTSIADSGTLSGTKWAYTAGANFGVTTNGTLYAKNAQISGSVAATNGFTVTSAATNGVTLASMTANGITLGQTTSNKFNILITDSAVSGKGPGILLRRGTNVLNEINAEGMNLYDSNANHLLSITPNKLEYISLSSTDTTFFFKRSDESKYYLQNSLEFYPLIQNYNMITTNKSYTFSDLSSLSSGTPIIIATATYHKLTNSSGSDWTPSGISYLIFNKNTSKTATLFSINNASISVTYNGNATFSFALTNGSATLIGYGPRVLTASLSSAPSYGHIGRDQTAGTDKLRGNHSFSMNNAIARGTYSCAINGGEAFGDYSFAAGISTAAGYGSTAFGTSNISYGSYSFVAGHNSEVFQHYGVAIGRGLKSINYDQTVFGKYNKLDTNAMFIIGNGTADDARSNLMAVGDTEVTIGNQDGGHTIISTSGMKIYGADGTIELANIGYGSGNSASGTADAPYYTLGKRSSNYAVGNYSVAEGVDTVARGYCAHAEGWGSEAQAFLSHAEGWATTARGIASHAEGASTYAIGDNSHAQNESTIAEKSAQTTLGTYNIRDIASTTTHPNGDANYGQYVVIIGNGTSDTARSNALTVDWSGNIIAQGMAGMVQMFAGATAPAGWLICDGAAVSRTTYATLFAVIGTTYGAGDGSTTFNLPDLRGRMPIGAGQGTGLTDRALASLGGSEYIQQHQHGFTNPTIASSGAHVHTLNLRNAGTSGGRATNNVTYGASGHDYQNANPFVSSGSHSHTYSANGAVGNVKDISTGQAGNMPPFIGINFIICTGKTS